MKKFHDFFSFTGTIHPSSFAKIAELGIGILLVVRFLFIHLKNKRRKS